MVFNSFVDFMIDIGAYIYDFFAVFGQISFIELADNHLPTNWEIIQFYNPLKQAYSGIDLSSLGIIEESFSAIFNTATDILLVVNVQYFYQAVLYMLIPMCLLFFTVVIIFDIFNLFN